MDEGKKPVNAVSVSSSDFGESLFRIQLTPEIDSVHAIQRKNRRDFTAYDFRRIFWQMQMESFALRDFTR